MIDGLLRTAREVLLDSVIDTGKRSFGNGSAECLSALLDEGLELCDVRSGSNDTPHGYFNLRSAMKAAISVWY